MRLYTNWQSLACAFAVIAPSVVAYAESPRTKLQPPAHIGGRAVRELLVATPIRVGHPLGPGGPTVPMFTIASGRFLPVSEDQEFVYFQAIGAFAQGLSERGGLRVMKAFPRYVFPYEGDATYVKMPLDVGDVLPIADVQKIRVVFADSKPPHKPPKKP